MNRIVSLNAKREDIYQKVFEKLIEGGYVYEDSRPPMRCGNAVKQRGRILSSATITTIAPE